MIGPPAIPVLIAPTPRSLARSVTRSFVRSLDRYEGKTNLITFLSFSLSLSRSLSLFVCLRWIVSYEFLKVCTRVYVCSFKRKKIWKEINIK